MHGFMFHYYSWVTDSRGKRVHSLSRTWSRRDTTGSGRADAPNWTNQARFIARAEDIVINRDLERGEMDDDNESAYTQ